MTSCLVHEYINDVTGIIDGANLYYVELSNMLAKFNHTNKINIKWHDLFTDLKKKTLTQKLRDIDVVLCSAGPYAYIYHYYREKYNLNFRIVRDVQTAYWGGYLLQEFLCNPLTKEEDIVLVPSFYTIQVLKEAFKSGWYLSHSVIFNPSVDEYPSIDLSKGYQENQLKIGYLGRISKDKNFDQLVELSKQMTKFFKVKLYIAGKVYKNQFDMLKLKKELKKRNVEMHYEGYVNNIWDFLRKFDILIFFSTSNVESLGRVVLEAIKARKKILAANFGAMPEILSSENLLPVSYYNMRKTCNDVFPIGCVDLSKVTSTLELKPTSLSVLDKYQGSSSILLKVLLGNTHYVRSIKYYNNCIFPITNIPEIDKSSAMSKIKKINSFLFSQGNLLLGVRSTLSILAHSKNKLRSLHFLSYYWKSKVTYSTLGHFPIEACWVIGFNPILNTRRYD